MQGISVASSGIKLIVDENEVRFESIWNKARLDKLMVDICCFDPIDDYI
jgi:hypothetical protein